jgi:hypothetical protein
MLEKEDPSFDRISYGESWNVEHPDDRDDELHREGGIPHRQGMVVNIDKDIDFPHCYGLGYA